MLTKLTEEEYTKILDFKRDLHMHPELSLKEFRTTGRIKEFLSQIPGIEIIDIDFPTGVAARMRGSLPGPETLLRADIDALPQTELYESPWKSLTPGIMHACGHDFHTASLLGAALILSRFYKEGTLPGTVDFLFQPAEEGTKGARALIRAGLFEKIHPDRCFGCHNWPSVESGKIVVHEGPLMAAKCNFTIRIFGSGGHGSMPHLNKDPIVCSAAVIGALQTVISRNMNPLDSAVLSINYIEGGSPVNLVVEKVEMKGTIRSLSDEALSRAIKRIKDIVSNTAEAYECTSDLEWEERIPAVVNTTDLLSIAVEAASGAGTVTDAPPSLASEDFAVYSEYAPSFYYWIGSTAPGEKAEHLHRPNFHTDDSVLEAAAEVYARSALAGG